MLSIGDKLPDFELKDQDGNLVRYSDYKGKRLILYAFPMAGTGKCDRQACGYRDNYDDITADNGDVLGITGNPIRQIKPWHRELNLPFNVLCDTKHVLLDQLGAWGHSIIPGIKIPLAHRIYWVIDENGIIIEKQEVESATKSLNESLNLIRISAE